MEVIMNKSILAVSTILALGTVGCASAGTQYTGTVVDSNAASTQYAARGLGTLWEPSPAQPSGLEQRVAVETVGSDLWNGASVGRGWENNEPKDDPKATFGATTTRMKF